LRELLQSKTGAFRTNGLEREEEKAEEREVKSEVIGNDRR
jgi:hypothetical protein